MEAEIFAVMATSYFPKCHEVLMDELPLGKALGLMAELQAIGHDAVELLPRELGQCSSATQRRYAEAHPPWCSGPVAFQEGEFVPPEGEKYLYFLQVVQPWLGDGLEFEALAEPGFENFLVALAAQPDAILVGYSVCRVADGLNSRVGRASMPDPLAVWVPEGKEVIQ